MPPTIHTNNIVYIFMYVRYVRYVCVYCVYMYVSINVCMHAHVYVCMNSSAVPGQYVNVFAVEET